ncbi:MAG: tetratricopeptide repeat protein [Tannerella sp.]|nr:tetratricopeptide repeat protein [Tannerella sp.]
MKRFLLIAGICGSCLSGTAQKKMPKWVEKAKKAVIALEIQDKNGITRQGNGFFIHENGEAISDYTLFAGAEKAFATDTEGRRLPVTRILGADEFYDVIRFQVEVPKPVTALAPATSLPAQGTEACLLPCGTEKGAPAPTGTIEEISKLKEQYGYFRTNIPWTASQLSLPLLTATGEVFALAQADASGKNQTYGISVPYVLSLHMGAMDVLNKTYASIGIRKAWASTPEDAQVALMFYASQQDAPAYLETLSDFIDAFPHSSAGYLSRAAHCATRRKELADTDAAQQQMLARALADIETAAKYMEGKGVLCYERAKLIYNTVATDSSLHELADWNMDAAWTNIRQAIAEDDQPAYRQLEGDIAFYRGDYEQACASYRIVTQSPLASAIAFYLAAKSKQQIPDANLSEVVELLDSAAARSAAVSIDAVTYLEENAELKMQLGRYDDAVKDYDRCYLLSQGNVSDVFYYYREQAKFRAGDLDGAQKDISSAIIMSPQNAVYYAEEAAIYLRRQLPDQAQASVQRALSLDPDFASGHRLLGISYLRQGKKDEACNAFRKAKELGDPVVDKLMKENCR